VCDTHTHSDTHMAGHVNTARGGRAELLHTHIWYMCSYTHSNQSMHTQSLENTPIQIRNKYTLEQTHERAFTPKPNHTHT
jgi:hypothetical protein